MLAAVRKRPRSPGVSLQIPQPTGNSFYKSINSTSNSISYLSFSLTVPTLLIKNLNPEQLRTAKQISFERALKILSFDVSLVDLEPRTLQSSTSPQTRRQRSQQSSSNQASSNPAEKMQYLFFLGEHLIKHARGVTGLFQTPASPERVAVISKALPQLTSILKSCELQLNASDVHEVAHLFYHHTQSTVPNLPLAFSPILKGILTVHKTTFVYFYNAFMGSESKDGLSVSAATGKLVRDLFVLLPPFYRGTLQYVLHVLARIVQFETDVQVKRQIINGLARVFGPVMILEAEGRKIKRMIDLSATLLDILLTCHGVVYPVDIDHSMMYHVSAASLMNAKKATLLLSPVRSSRIMAFATPSRKKVDMAASRDLFDLFTGKGGDGFVYVSDGVCLTPTIDTLLMNKEQFVKRLRVERDDA